MRLEQFLDLDEDATEDLFNPFGLGVVGFPCNVPDEKLQIAEGEHHFVPRKRGFDRLFDMLVQENQSGEKQLAFCLGQFKPNFLAFLDALRQCMYEVRVMNEGGEQPRQLIATRPLRLILPGATRLVKGDVFSTSWSL